MDVKIELAQDPVYMKWLDGKGLNCEYRLWNEIYAHEYFPKNAESAKYVLTLQKCVNHHSEVSKIKAELVDALARLSEAWVFSGGSLLPIKEKRLIYQPLYYSNAHDVEKELLVREGKTKVYSSLSIAWECGCTYYEAPLRKAIRICTAAISRPEIQKVIKYYTDARLNDEKWFIDLYKVRDSIKDVYGSDAKAIEALSIDKDDWSYFGKVLNNNDLRHPPKSGTPRSSLREEDKNKVEVLAREWVSRFLKYEGVV
jgi:hypothetical protein